MRQVILVNEQSNGKLALSNMDLGEVQTIKQGKEMIARYHQEYRHEYYLLSTEVVARKVRKVRGSSYYYSITNVDGLVKYYAIL